MTVLVPPSQHSAGGGGCCGALTPRGWLSPGATVAQEQGLALLQPRVSCLPWDGWAARCRNTPRHAAVTRLMSEWHWGHCTGDARTLLLAGKGGTVTSTPPKPSHEGQPAARGHPPLWGSGMGLPGWSRVGAGVHCPHVPSDPMETGTSSRRPGCHPGWGAAQSPKPVALQTQGPA